MEEEDSEFALTQAVEILNRSLAETADSPYGETEEDPAEDSGDYFLEYDKVLAYERYEPTLEDNLVNRYISVVSGFFMARCQTEDIMAVYSLSEESSCSRSSSQISSVSSEEESSKDVEKSIRTTSKTVLQRKSTAKLRLSRVSSMRRRKKPSVYGSNISQRPIVTDQLSVAPSQPILESILLEPIESTSSGMSSDESSLFLFNQDDLKLNKWRYLPKDQMADIAFKSGATYRGRLSLGLMEGKGTYRWTDNTLYKGRFEGGEASGWAFLRWPNRDWYEGSMSRNMRHGSGTMFISGGNAFYTGDWNRGKKDGQGLMVYGKNDWYNGDWSNGTMDGYGMRSYPSGSVYAGDWSNGVRHGLGIMLWKNYDVYNGEWKNGLMDGVGTYVWQAFRNEQFAYPFHNWYYGEWRQGKRHGYGVMLITSGAVLRGEWCNGKKEGWAEIVCTDGTIVRTDHLFLDNRVETLRLKEFCQHCPSPPLIPFGRTPGAKKKRKKRKRRKVCPWKAAVYEPRQEGKRWEGRRIPVNAPVYTTYLNKYVEEYLEWNEKGTGGEVCLCDEEYVLEETWLRKVVRRRMPLLAKTYQAYGTLLSGIQCGYSPDFRPGLLRISLWTLLRDCGLYETGLSIVEMDAIMGYKSYPFDYVPMFAMVHYLLTLSWELYGKNGLRSHDVPGYLGGAFDLFVKQRVLNALDYPTVELLASFDAVPLTSVYDLYVSLGEKLSLGDLFKKMSPAKRTRFVPLIPSPSRHFNRTFTGHNQLQPCGPLMSFNAVGAGVAGAGEYLDLERYLKEENASLLLLGLIGPKRLLIQLLKACPPAQSPYTGVVDVHYRVSFLEFLDFLSGCIRVYGEMEKAWSERLEEVIGDAEMTLLDDEGYVPSEPGYDSLSSTPSAGSASVGSGDCSSVCRAEASSACTLPLTSSPSPSLLGGFSSSSLSTTHDSSLPLSPLTDPSSATFVSSSSCSSIHDSSSEERRSITFCELGPSGPLRAPDAPSPPISPAPSDENLKLSESESDMVPKKRNTEKKRKRAKKRKPSSGSSSTSSLSKKSSSSSPSSVLSSSSSVTSKDTILSYLYSFSPSSSLSPFSYASSSMPDSTTPPGREEIREGQGEVKDADESCSCTSSGITVSSSSSSSEVGKGPPWEPRLVRDGNSVTSLTGTEPRSTPSPVSDSSLSASRSDYAPSLRSVSTPKSRSRSPTRRSPIEKGFDSVLRASTAIAPLLKRDRKMSEEPQNLTEENISSRCCSDDDPSSRTVPPLPGPEEFASRSFDSILFDSSTTNPPYSSTPTHSISLSMPSFPSHISLADYLPKVDSPVNESSGDITLAPLPFEYSSSSLSYSSSSDEQTTSSDLSSSTSWESSSLFSQDSVRDVAFPPSPSSSLSAESFFSSQPSSKKNLSVSSSGSESLSSDSSDSALSIDATREVKNIMKNNGLKNIVSK